MPAPKRQALPVATPAKKATPATRAVKAAAKAAKPAANAVKKAPAKAAAPKAAPKATAKAAPKATAPSASKQAAAAKKSPAATKAAPGKATAATPAAKAAVPSEKGKTTSPSKATPNKAAAKSAPAKAAPAKSAEKAAPAKKAPAKTAAKAADPKPEVKAAKDKPAFDKKFFDEQRELLLEERAKYLRSAQLLKAEADALMLEREPGDVQFDEESGEGDTLAVERDFDLARSAQARQQVEDIDAALARIDDGTYGLCRVSGLPIPKERLRAIPWATERVEYKVGGLGRR